MKQSDSKDEAAKAAAKAEKEKKDAMANIDINNYASKYTRLLFLIICCVNCLVCSIFALKCVN